ncbi:MAG TPA: iron-containing redox enzyme family protein [Myxococcota bacterium]|nr:iron-containing redox enzyme family protein [Myxococcota bacterium]
MPFFDEMQQRTSRAREELLSIPIIRDCLGGRVRRDQYAAFLREAYHHVKHTVPLLQACMERIGADRTTVREALAHYIEDERGHEQWILDDLRAFGEDAEAVRRGMPAPATRRMVEYVYDYIERSNPIGFFGMAHVLEGTSAALATSAAHTIGRVLGLPPAALTYLTSHGSLDQDHVRFFAGVVNALPAEDQEAVVHVAGAVYPLYGDIFRGLPQ